MVVTFTSIFIVSFIIQLVYYLPVYLRIFKPDNRFENKHYLPPVSIIISARNEAENLRNFLPLILNQDYPNFEVVVVNDNSEDKTQDVLLRYKKKYENLIILNADKNIFEEGNKKSAITKAILSAKNNLLIFTDADCYPVSNKWLKKMTSAYSENTEILIGFGAYEEQRGFLNKIIRYETLFNTLQFMSFADLGFPYMAVGRNLSYKKSVFLKIKGFESHKDIISGDDDLFINDAANRKNTNIITDFESKTISIPKDSFKTYFNQKKRHFSSSSKYRLRNKIIIGIEIITRFLFYLFFVVLLIYGNNYRIVLAILFVRIIVSLTVIKLFALKMKESNILFFIPIFDILIPVLNLIVFTGTVFDNKIRWK